MQSGLSYSLPGEEDRAYPQGSLMEAPIRILLCSIRIRMINLLCRYYTRT
jgi:hypothetical protein